MRKVIDPAMIDFIYKDIDALTVDQLEFLNKVTTVTMLGVSFKIDAAGIRRMTTREGIQQQLEDFELRVGLVWYVRYVPEVERFDLTRAAVELSRESFYEHQLTEQA